MTRADQRRYDAFQAYGCVACRMMGWYGVPEVNHLVDKGNRAASGGNQATIPLCPWHHRGVAPEGYTNARASFYFGWSMAHNPRQFKMRYGTQRELLAKVNAELGLGEMA